MFSPNFPLRQTVAAPSDDPLVSLQLEAAGARAHYHCLDTITKHFEARRFNCIDRYRHGFYHSFGGPKSRFIAYPFYLPRFQRARDRTEHRMWTFPGGAFLFLAAAIVTGVGVYRFRIWAERRRLFDFPNERSSHSHPTPRGGGLVITGVTLFCGCFLAAVPDASSFGTAYLPYACGALIVAAVSWIDDLRSLPSFIRLAAHLVAAFVVIAGLGYWQAIALPLRGTINLGPWGIILMAIWIVGFTNDFNFMDGINGIARSQA
jgi:hypothetical protein